jgi:enamine deaminase RidA (YjgF/YER057c/UK114 family)
MSQLMHIPAPDGVAPGNGYTNVVTGTGRLIAVSGQVALAADGTVVGRGDPEAQARQVFENLRGCLAAALVRPEFLLEVEALALVPA